jgi:DNA polymerase-3 subunit epsilon
MYAIVDIETTGGFAAANGITEIAVYLYDGQRIYKKFETLVNPQLPIPPYIRALTGITEEMVADAPIFEEIASTLYDLLKDQIFIAHNVNFDYSFIKHHLQRCGFELDAKKICTVRLSKKVFPGYPSYSLGKICRSLNIEIDNRHRAGGDAKATVQLFEQCLQHPDGMEQINKMLKRTSGDQWLPLHLERKDIDQLPQTPGVYYFHDEKDKVIYVGKAVNIRKRVTGHFTHYDVHQKRQQFLLHIRRISFQACVSELHAIVLESIEIKRLWPKHNRSQKQPVQKYGLYIYDDHKGYQRLVIDKKKRHLPAVYQFNLLHEGQVMLRKLVDEFGLHEKLCLLNKAPISEAEWQELERPKKYNQRIQKAIKTLSEQIPSFAVIEEEDGAAETLCMLVWKGSFWGMGYIADKSILDSAPQLMEQLQPYPDNDTIRNHIYSYIAQYPEKKRVFS